MFHYLVHGICEYVIPLFFLDPGGSFKHQFCCFRNERHIGFLKFQDVGRTCGTWLWDGGMIFLQGYQCLCCFQLCKGGQCCYRFTVIFDQVIYFRDSIVLCLLFSFPIILFINCQSFLLFCLYSLHLSCK